MLVEQEPVFINFYDPWSEESKGLDETWKSLGKRCQKEGLTTIAQVKHFIRILPLRRLKLRDKLIYHFLCPCRQLPYLLSSFSWTKFTLILSCFFLQIDCSRYSEICKKYEVKLRLHFYAILRWNQFLYILQRVWRQEMTNTPKNTTGTQTLYYGNFFYFRQFTTQH